MKARFAFVLVALFSTWYVIAAEQRQLKAEDLLDEVSVGAPVVSPDGRWVVYSVTRFDRVKERSDGDLYLVAVNGGTPRQLTSAAGVESGPSWSPDSKRIAFSAKRDLDKSQIYVISLDGGEAVRLTSIGTGASEPLWSPDGAWIAFTSSIGERLSAEQSKAFGDVRYVMHPRFYHLGRGWDDGTRKRIFVVPVAGGEPKQLTSGECSDEGDDQMVWRPDSGAIAFVSNRSSEWWNSIDTNIYVVDIATGNTQMLTTNPGPDNSPEYSPDDSRIAYRASYEYNYESENYKIHVMPAAGGETRALTAKLDRNVRSLAWDPAGTRIYFTASDRGAANLRAVDPVRPDAFVEITKGSQSVMSFHPLGGDRFVLRRTTDVAPAEIFAVAGGTMTQLTRHASEFWAQFAVAPAEEIWLKAEDGTALQGWLIKPIGYEQGVRVPLILEIHGGPHGMYSPTLRLAYQLLAHNGYAVLLTNPRGSDGYGQAFCDAIVKDWHTKPQSDVMRFVDKAIEMGVADKAKLGVTGGSYGGYLTNWLIGHTDRFTAAVSVAGLSNMVSFWGTTDEQFFPEKEMAGPPWLSKEAHLENSPLFAAPRIKTPTMVVHGANDWRVLPEQGVQLFLALQKVGVPSVYVDFPNEQHGVSGKAHQVVYQKLLLEWFDHWMLGKPVQLATYITPRPYTHPPTPPK